MSVILETRQLCKFYGAGEIAGHPALEQAYQMGKEV